MEIWNFEGAGRFLIYQMLIHWGKGFETSQGCLKWAAGGFV